MSKVPKPRIPGVSMMYPSPVAVGEGSGIISEKVVVCVPWSCASLMAAVLRSAPGTRALMMVLLPTPLFPLKREILPCSSSRSLSSPVPSVADTRSVA